MPEPVRPIALNEIMEARERIAGTVLRTPLVKLDLGTGGPDIYLKLENLQPINAYKLRGAANAVRDSAGRRAQAWRVDDQRRQCRAGRRLCGAHGRRAVHRRGDRDRAADQARAHARARREARAGVLRRGLAGTAERHDSPAWTAPSSIRSTITISSPATPRWGSRSSRMRRTCAAVIAAIGGGGLVTGVGSAIKALKPDVKVFGAEPETAAPFALSSRRRRREVPRLASLVRRRRRRARASSRACGSGCARSSTARSP